MSGLVDHLALRIAAPARTPHHLPQLDITEVVEEGQLAQHIEALRILDLIELGLWRQLAAGQTREGTAEAFPIGIAISCLSGHGFEDHGVEGRGDTTATAEQRSWCFGLDLVHQGGLAGCVKRCATGHQVVEHGAQRIDVGAAVEVAALDLFRCHIGQRADPVHLGAV